jgi:hypothetical protein
MLGALENRNSNVEGSIGSVVTHCAPGFVAMYNVPS